MYLKCSTENTVEFWLAQKKLLKIQNTWYYTTPHATDILESELINYEAKILIKELHGANIDAKFDPGNKNGINWDILIILMYREVFCYKNK